MARLILLSLAFCLSAHAGDRYTDAMYRRALTYQSTAPLYVLVTLREPRSGERRLVCIQGPFLLGAIHKERHLGFDRAGERKALRIALRQRGREFAFESEDARRNASPRYTPEMLAEVRNALGAVSNPELIEQVRRRSPLHELYESRDGEQFLAWREAVAHFLLERGILVGHGDIPAGLYLWSDWEKRLKAWGELR